LSLNFLRVFQNQNCFILSKRKPWPNTCKIYKDFCVIFILKYSSFQERNYLLTQKIIVQETVGLLSCKNLWTQGKGIPVRFRLCKRILQDSGNLKRVAWELNVGTRCSRTSIKAEFAFSLPLNFFNLLQFIFALKKFNLNCSLINSY